MQRRGVTFVEDLHANRWSYATSALGVAMFVGLKALGADFWVALMVPVLLAAGVGFVMRRRG